MIRRVATAIVCALLALLCGRLALAEGLPPVGTYEQEAAKLKVAGIPLTIDALQQPMPPDSDNAAIIYSKLGPLFASHKVESDELGNLVSGSVPSDDALARLRTIVDNNGDVLDLIREAANKPKCVFAVRSTGGDVQFPQNAVLRNASRWIAADCLVKVHGGSAVAAVDEAAIEFKIADQAETVPSLICALTKVSIQEIAFHNLDKVLYLSAGVKETAAEVRTVVATNFQPVDLDATYRGEATAAIDGRVLLNLLESTDEASDHAQTFRQEAAGLAGPSVNIISDRALVRANIPYLVNRLRLLSEIADGPLDRVQAVRDQIHAEWSTNPSPDRVLGSMLLLGFIPASEKRMQSIADARIRRVAAQLLEWKGAYGTFPDSLKQLPGPPADDPFGHGLLGYRRESDGFVVYSVGKSGDYMADDPKVKPTADEPTFRWPQPAYLK